MTSPYSFDQCVCIPLSLSPMHSYTHTQTLWFCFLQTVCFFFFCAHYLETRVLVESW